MLDMEEACAKAIRKELHFIDHMQRARKPPFQDALGWRNVDGGGDVLAARCWKARTIWARAIVESVYAYFEVSVASPKPNRRLWHVTLALDDFCCPMTERIDTHELHKMLRWIPEGWPIFGCYEAGFFYDLSFVPGELEQGFSWHAHMFVMDVRLPEMQEAAEYINSQRRGMAGLPAVVYRRVGKHRFPKIARYVFKPPLEQYSVGKPILGRDGRPVYIVNPKRSGPANLVHSWNALAGRYLDELTFAAGDGCQVLRRVKERAADLTLSTSFEGRL